MPTLNRYIARLYLTNILILLVVLFGFIVTVDVFVNLGRFYKAAVTTGVNVASGANDEGFLHHLVLTLIGIVRLWAPRVLQLFVYLNGVVLVAAMGFTCAQLVRHREFVAVLSSGVSLHRVARPFVVVAFAMTLVQLVDQEFGVPAVATLLARDAGDSFKDELDPFRVRLASDAQGRLFNAGKFDTTGSAAGQAGILEDLTVWERDSAGRLTRVITAERATWDGKGYTLTNGRAGAPAAISAPKPGKKTEAGTAASPLAGTTPIARIDTTLDPTTLKIRNLSSFGEALSTRQLQQVISSGGLDQRASERLQRLQWGRFAGLLSNIITLFAALPFFLLRVPQPLLIPALKSAPIALAGLAASAAGAGLALPGLPVWLGVFVPSLLLLPVAIALFTSIKT